MYCGKEYRSAVPDGKGTELYSLLYSAIIVPGSRHFDHVIYRFAIYEENTEN